MNHEKKPYEIPINKVELLILVMRAKNQMNQTAPFNGIDPILRDAFGWFILACEHLKKRLPT